MQGISVHFRTTCPTHFGDSVYVVGDIEELGEWDPKKAFSLLWATEDIWVGQLTLPFKHYKSLEYKYVRYNTDLNASCQNFDWEPGENRVLFLQGNIAMEVQDCWNCKQKTTFAILNEDPIEKELLKISKEAVKIEKFLENNQKELNKLLKNLEEKRFFDLLYADEGIYSSDFQQIILLLFYLYRSQSIGISLVESGNIASSFRSQFWEILYTFVRKIKNIVFIIIEILKTSETCMISFENEWEKLTRSKNTFESYTESFRSGIFIESLTIAITSFNDYLEKSNFPLLENQLKIKLIDATSDISFIEQSFNKFEILLNERATIEKRIKDTKNETKRMTTSIDLIILCKRYFLSIQNGDLAEITKYELDLQNILKKIIGKDLDMTSLYNMMGIINSIIFKKYSTAITHPGCEESFQQVFFELNFSDSFDKKDLTTLHSFIDQSYTEIFEVASKLNVHMRLRNEADRGLLIFFLNYMIFHYAIKQQKPDFPYFTSSGCSEMGSFLDEKETDLSLKNFLILGKEISENYWKSSTLIQTWKNLNEEIASLEEFLLKECEEYRGNDYVSLMNMVITLQKIRVDIFGGDLQVALFSKILKESAETISDFARRIDEQDEITLKYGISVILAEGPEVKNFRYLVNGIKNKILNIEKGN